LLIEISKQGYFYRLGWPFVCNPTTNGRIKMTSERMQVLYKKASSGPKLRLGLVCPASDEVLEAAVLVDQKDIFEPVLIGDADAIKSLSDKMQIDLSAYQCVDVKGEEAAILKAVEMVNAGEIHALMKGSCHTNTFMSKIVSREAGLRTDRRMTHVMLVDAPAYKKLLVYSDVAFNIYPDLKVKTDIVKNAIDFTRSLGVEKPKVALLSCVDAPSDKLPSSEDDAKILEMIDAGEIQDAFVAGPIQFDAAISEEVAKIKKSTSPVAGDADVLIFPNLESGNIAVKEVELLGGANCYGIAVGVKVPLIVTSRAATTESRLGSCVLAKFYAEYLKKD